jgi:diguanylate cyclase (GGDEF)-like protein
MDYVIFNSVYKDFRDAILDNVPDINALIKRVSSAIPPICNILNIGYIRIKLIAPSSIIAKDGLNEEKIVYEDPAGYEPVPLIQTYRTGENGMATIEVRARKNHKFSNPELQAAKLVCDDLFIMFGRARLMGAIHYASQTDTMTGAPNTAKLVHHSIELKAQNKLQNFSGIFLNLKNYKYINQSKSPVIGDKGITLFAHYIMSLCHDGEMIARLGGDNFFVLVKKRKQGRVHQKTDLGEFKRSDTAIAANSADHTKPHGRLRHPAERFDERNHALHICRTERIQSPSRQRHRIFLQAHARKRLPRKRNFFSFP